MFSSLCLWECRRERESRKKRKTKNPDDDDDDATPSQNTFFLSRSTNINKPLLLFSALFGTLSIVSFFSLSTPIESLISAAFERAKKKGEQAEAKRESDRHR